MATLSIKFENMYQLHAALALESGSSFYVRDLKREGAFLCDCWSSLNKLRIWRRKIYIAGIERLCRK